MTNGDLRNALYIGLLFAGAYWIPIGDAALRAKAPQESHTYANGHELVLHNCLYCTSSVTLRIGDGCVGVDGILGWGGFFFNLKRKMTPDGPVFRVGRRTVTEFPDEVRLIVALTSGVPCLRGKPPGAAIPSLETLKSPRAEAVYIRDMKMHPLEISLSEEGNTPPPGAPPVPLNCRGKVRRSYSSKVESSCWGGASWRDEKPTGAMDEPEGSGPVEGVARS